MIDKLTLNNEIVLMRKLVRQARVHVIRKLIRDVKKLRASKGDDAVKAKCNKKAERKVEELMVIKKLNPDVASKFALKNTENAADKIADPNIDIEERALFRLTSSKVFVERVNQFRAKYPDWEEFINETLDELGANRQKNAKKSSKNNNDKIKMGSADKVETSANKVNGVKKSPAHSSQKSLVGRDGAKAAVPEINMKSKFNAGWTIEDIGRVQKIAGRKTAKGSAKKDGETKRWKMPSPTRDQKNSNLSSWDISENKKRKGAAEIRKFSELMSDNDDSPDEEETLQVKPADEEASPEGESVDPFFMSSDGTAEYRTNVKAADNEEDEDGQTWRKDKQFANEWGDNRRNSFNDRGHPHRGRGHPDRGGGQFGRGRGHPDRGGQFGRGRGNSDRGRGQFGRGAGQFGRGAGQSGRGAGQFGRGAGQSGRGAGPSGRGAGQFGRGGQFSSERGSNRDRGGGFGSGGKTWNDNSKFKPSPALPSAGDSNLHPSWEAKRKQKEQSISSVVFQGKKIKFDDD